MAFDRSYRQYCPDHAQHPNYRRARRPYTCPVCEGTEDESEDRSGVQKGALTQTVESAESELHRRFDLDAYRPPRGWALEDDMEHMASILDTEQFGLPRQPGAAYLLLVGAQALRERQEELNGRPVISTSGGSNYSAWVRLTCPECAATELFDGYGRAQIPLEDHEDGCQWGPANWIDFEKVDAEMAERAAPRKALVRAIIAAREAGDIELLTELQHRYRERDW